MPGFIGPVTEPTEYAAYAEHAEYAPSAMRTRTVTRAETSTVARPGTGTGTGPGTGTGTWTGQRAGTRTWAQAWRVAGSAVRGTVDAGPGGAAESAEFHIQVLRFAEGRKGRPVKTGREEGIGHAKGGNARRDGRQRSCPL
ncbi:ABC transporter, ATP-binding protein [Streptomyces laurentii]|uniref:ABC transporter, ATP-binding protein n=1 Tax=Streptomyces laurentii TaxID=39478 RepID=A0A169NX15_STRLU|nr:ABC transporter, ATP-binding protein [Streptomyces laurentii]